MFKYTPLPHIMHGWASARKPWVRDKEYKFIETVLREHGIPQSYTLHVAFWRQYETVEFYSPKRPAGVPLDGYLFPLSMFVEEQV